ncbi:MAG: TAXI family TRAP transporter solute-binding subunit [Magnetococcales bacterium]|nr:TAXI family TRAP transporter solute-binding subunit [Magnetococcales bacterium]
MRTIAAILCCALIFQYHSTGYAQEQLLTIKTGSADGTYYKFGEDLRRLGSMHGFTVRVVPSEGSLENLQAIVQDEQVHLAIIQTDVIDWLTEKMINNPTAAKGLRDLKVKTRWLMPLYQEEVHLFARHEIRSLEDLQAKKVGAGSKRAGNFLTAGRLFETAGIDPQIVPLRFPEALRKLAQGEIDAVMIVGGAPVPFLEQDVDRLLSRQGEERLRLLPIENKKMQRHYSVVKLDPMIYSWLQEPVTTVAVKAALVTFDFAADHAQCRVLGEFVKLIENQIGWLREYGHRKWRDVDPSYLFPAHFQRSSCLQ